MKNLLKVIAALLLAVALFVSGALYAVYNAEVEIVGNSVEIDVLGQCWTYEG